jgi:hypothetical protein
LPVSAWAELRIGERLHLLAERGVLADALLLDLVDLGADELELLADRLYEVGDRLLARLELAAGASYWNSPSEARARSRND